MIFKEELNNKNKIIETFKCCLSNAQTVIDEQQVKSDKDKQSIENKVVECKYFGTNVINFIS